MSEDPGSLPALWAIQSPGAVSPSVQVQRDVQPRERRLQPLDRLLFVCDPWQIAEEQILQVPVSKQRV